jgi:23S rRNA-/tRNA-specific pseudouridylate synthase
VIIDILSSIYIVRYQFNFHCMRKRQSGKKKAIRAAQEGEHGEYRLEEGDVRYVEPYVFTHSTYAKGRWYERSIIDVVTSEFGAHPESYWRRAIQLGNVRVNNKIVSEDYLFKNGDLFIHRTHRHEPPIYGHIEFVGETDKVLCVTKPSSMPMHPCGAYRDNSFEYILRREPIVSEQPSDLKIVHRLDRVTSGIVVVAKGREMGNQIQLQMKAKETTKIYLARVRGRFPDPTRLAQFRRLQGDRKTLLHIDDTQLHDGRVISKKRNTEDVSVCMSSATQKEGQSASKRGPGVDLTTEVTETISATTTTTTTTTTNNRSKIKSIPTFEDIIKFPDVGIAWLNIGDEVQSRLYSSHIQPFPMSSPNSFSNIDDNNNNNNNNNSTDNNTTPLENTTLMSSDDALLLRAPIGVVDHKEGVYACMADTKDSISLFRVVGEYDAVHDTTLVECRPYTGRTHQLRIHLQLLGHPIANDPCYGGELFYGDSERLTEAKRTYANIQARGLKALSKVPHLIEDEKKDKEKYQEQEQEQEKPIEWYKQGENENITEYMTRTCRYCNNDELLHLEKLLHCDGIWLHAQLYACGGETVGDSWGPFEAPLPKWTQPFLNNNKISLK